jgi:hypothetical protein
VECGGRAEGTPAHPALAGDDEKAAFEHTSEVRESIGTLPLSRRSSPAEP